MSSQSKPVSLSLFLIFFLFFCSFLINTDLCFLLSSFILRFVLSFALLFFYFFLFFFGWANVSRDDIKISSLRTGVWLTFGRRMFHRMCERKFDGSILLCKKKKEKKCRISARVSKAWSVVRNTFDRPTKFRFLKLADEKCLQYYWVSTNSIVAWSFPRAWKKKKVIFLFRG